MLQKRVIALFLLVGLLTGVLTACGADTKPPEEPNNGEISSSGEPIYGGELVVGISQDLGDSLDPYQMTAAGTREVLFNVYEGLVKPDKDGAFIPALASSLPEISDDGMRYTFALREDVKFHNGQIVTVEDIIKSFETCAATTVDTDLAAALSAVESVTAANRTEIELILREPNVDLLSYIASVFIVPADYAEQATAPVGTGPFMFTSRSIQSNVVLTKFADYWGDPAYLDTVTLRIFEDSTPLMTTLNAGGLDMAIHLTSDQINTLDANTYNAVEGTMNLVQALYLNHAVAPFDNEAVRKAMCHAVDVDALLALPADGHGTKLGSSIYPAFAKYFDESLVDAYPYDPELAVTMLADAGYPDGFTMSISVPSNYAPHVNTAEVLAEQLTAVGITVEIKLVEWGTWISDVYRGRNFESTVIGFDAVSLTAGALLNRFVSGDSTNFINHSNEDYDRLMRQAEATLDDGMRTDLYRQAAATLSETAANVYLQDMADFVALRQGLSGYVFYPLYVMDLSTIHYVG